MKIINIMLSSLNGKIAFHDSESSLERRQNKFTCEEDFQRMRILVSQCDVVFTGLKSIECERGAFRVANLRPTNTEPEWIIFTQTPISSLKLKSLFWKQKGMTKSLCFISSFNINIKPVFKMEIIKNNFFIHSNSHEADEYINYYTCNISGLIQHLENSSIQKAALLGGGKLNSLFWQHDLIDELYLTLSPFIVNRDNAPNLLEFSQFISKKLILLNTRCQNNFAFFDYSVEKK